MKIVLWIGNEPNQRALANKIHSVFPLSAIVAESRKTRRMLSLRILVEKLVEKLFLASIGKSWRNMLRYYESAFPDYPEVNFLEVENINSGEVLDFTLQSTPDLVLVSGTRLIKEEMLNAEMSIGMLNLHTGLSPYVKGGPNCTNWCIADKNFHLIGNTVMWIDKGIDTGNILTTEYVDCSGNESLPELHIKVMEHAHALCLKAVRFLFEGNKITVPQSEICEGKTFYSKQWTLKQKIKLVKNYPDFKKYYDSGKVAALRKSVKTVGL